MYKKQAYLNFTGTDLANSFQFFLLIVKLFLLNSAWSI